MRSAMPKFKSVIVMDLETTGLPRLENNKTRITELAMVGCEREHCTESGKLPRVLQKLVLCINPLKMISPFASDMTGLHNELLEHSSPFGDKTALLLKTFIENMAAPVCLVAHNGNGFDFPILRKELLRSEVLLPDDVYCADSKVAFEHILQGEKSKEQHFGSYEDDVTCLTAMTQFEAETPPPTPQKDAKESSGITNLNVCRNLEKTFQALPLERQLSIDAKRSFEEVPVQQNKRFCRNFLTGYAMKNIFEYYHGKKLEGAHTAEADTVGLLSCMVQCGPSFFDWMDNNAKLLSTIQPLI